MKKDFFLAKAKAIVTIEEHHKLIIQLAGEQGDEYQRAQRAKNRLEQSMRCLFKDHPIYMAMISWGTIIALRKQLIECNIPNKVIEQWIKGDPKDGIFDAQLFKPNLIYYSHDLSISNALKIGTGIINNELGLDPYIHANFYFMNLSNKMFLINLFDDRYLEFICHTKCSDYFIKKFTQEGVVFS